jgi:hypothetical protein
VAAAVAEAVAEPVERVTVTPEAAQYYSPFKIDEEKIGQQKKVSLLCP